MIEITKPTVARLVTLDDTDDYTAALTVYEHREKLTAVLTPEQLHQFAHEAQELAEHLVRERDAAKADAERHRTGHAFDVDVALTPGVTREQLADAAPSFSADATRYVWIVRTEVPGMGLWDRQENLIAWWQRPVSETNREYVHAMVEDGQAEWLIWAPADTYRPFEIAVFS